MPLSPRQRFRIFERDLFTCRYCGRRPPEVVLEVDHIFPRSRGGSDAEGNLCTACRDCNAGKAAQPVTDLLRLKQRQEEHALMQAHWVEELWCKTFGDTEAVFWAIDPTP